MTLPTNKTTYANGREARAFDVVEGVIDYAENPRNPFLAQIVRVLPEPGLAEIALIRRPAAMAKRVPYFALQNLAAVTKRHFLPLDELKLRHRRPRYRRPIDYSLKPGLCD